MAKASAQEQLRLLDLQALDSRLNQLKRRTREVTQNPEIAALSAKVAGAGSELVIANTEVADIERELTRAENDVQTVVARLDRNRARLDSGTGSSKDLTALQSEVESLTRRRSNLEDVELDVMERLEAAKTRQAAQQEATDAAAAELAALEEQRDAELAVVAGERNEVLGMREELAATFEASTLAIYEKTLAQRGVGAARLFHGTSEGSGMQLSPGDLAQIRGAAEDDIVFCPDSGCILVRSAEWGS